MKNKKKKIKLYARIVILLFVFLYIFLFSNQVTAAQNCTEKYPNDGQCVGEDAKTKKTICPNNYTADKIKDLCPEKELCCHQGSAIIEYQFQVPIFGLTKTGSLAEYIGSIYEYSLYAIVPISIIMIIFAGLKWILAGGNMSKIAEAKKYISSAFTGLTIALLGYVVLSMIGLTTLTQFNAKYIRGLPDFSDYEDLQFELASGSSENYKFVKKTSPKNIVVITCETTTGPKKGQWDQSVASSVVSVCNKLKTAGFPVKSISHYRPGSKHCHGKGLAIDFNPEENYCVDCYGKKGAKVGKLYKPGENKYSLPQSAVSIMKSEGWCWGGDWGNIKDYMHFSKNCSKTECAKKGPYDWSLSAQQNQKNRNITWP